jgi:hypothetical protein
MAFCRSLSAKLRKVIKCVDKFLEENIDKALAVTNAIKQMLSSPVADTLVNLIPGHWDDTARVAALAALEYALKKLGKIKTVLNDPQLRDFLQWLESQPESIKETYLSKIASLMAEKLDGQRFQRALYDVFVQARYVEQKPDLKIQK